MRAHFAGCNWEQCRCELKRYWAVLAINFAVFILELFGGFISGSLSLLSDAGHVFTHTITIGIALGVAYVVYKNSSRERQIRKIGSCATALVFMALAFMICYEAVRRLQIMSEVYSLTMLGFAAVGCLGNYFQLRILNHHSKKNVTSRDLSFDMLLDLWQSLAVIVGAMIIFLTGLTIVDLALSLVIALVLLGRGVWQIYNLLKK